MTSQTDSPTAPKLFERHFTHEELALVKQMDARDSEPEVQLLRILLERLLTLIERESEAIALSSAAYRGETSEAKNAKDPLTPPGKKASGRTSALRARSRDMDQLLKLYAALFSGALRLLTGIRMQAQSGGEAGRTESGFGDALALFREELGI